MAQLDKNAVVAQLDNLLVLFEDRFTPGRPRQSKIIDALEPNDFMRHYMALLKIKLLQEDAVTRITPLMQQVIDEVKANAGP